MSNVMYNPPMNLGQPGSNVLSGGGGRTDLFGYRSILDARRAAAPGARTPSAEYPDGYLGNITARRGDRLLKDVQNRLTQRSYQRGVHKGERVDPGDYVWPADFNPMSGLEAEAKGIRWAPAGNPTERLAHAGQVNALSPEEIADAAERYGVNTGSSVASPARRAQMAGLMPGWK